MLPPPYGVAPGAEQEPVPGAEEWARADRVEGQRPGFLLVVARLMPYKHVREVVEAVRGTDRRLVVIGHGPERHRLERDLPANVRLFEHLSDAQMRWAYAHASALVAASHEDFGLTPLEAAGHGVPTVALRAGGYLDTVLDAETGTFFDTPTVPAIRRAIEEHEARRWDPDAIRAHAALFAEDRFVRRLRREVDELAGPVRSDEPERVR